MEVIVTGGTLSNEEQKYYESHVQEKYPHLEIHKLHLTVDGDFVNIAVEPKKRILTKMGGSLIGDPLTWNDAKRAEYLDTIPNSLDL